MNARNLYRVLAIILAALASAVTCAQDFPNRPIHMIPRPTAAAPT